METQINNKNTVEFAFSLAQTFYIALEIESRPDFIFGYTTAIKETASSDILEALEELLNYSVNNAKVESNIDLVPEFIKAKNAIEKSKRKNEYPQQSLK